MRSPPAGHYLSEQDLPVIIRSCLSGKGGGNTHIRDLAVILALASSGCRGSEITGINIEHLYLEDGRAWLGKTTGGRPRFAWLHPTAVDAVRQWLRIRGGAPGPLFVPLSRTGRPLLDHGALGYHQIWRIVKTRTAEAGYTGVATHDLRRYLISALLELTDVSTTRRIAGHSKVSTTIGYDQRPARREREAINQLAFPSLASIEGPRKEIGASWTCRRGELGHST